MSSSCLPPVMIVWTLSRWRALISPRSPSRSISACVIIAVSGVRRSWAMFDRNCVLSESRSRSSAMILPASMICAESSRRAESFDLWLMLPSAESPAMSPTTRPSAVIRSSHGRIRVSRFDRFFQLLPPQEGPVPSFIHHELFMTSLFHNTPAVEHDDLRGVANAARPVRGDNRCSTHQRNPELTQYIRFCVRVHRAQSIVEKDYRGFPRECSGK